VKRSTTHPDRQIADVLVTSEANAQQLVSRARVHLASEPRRQVSAAEQQRFIDAFGYAVQTADLTTLEQLVAALGRPVQG
jgi:RNA polymerase sigma-70 factor, ECF subfamily